MIDIIIAEFQKLKRYSILLIGLVTVVLSPVMSVFTQKSYIKPDLNYGFPNLVNDTIWNNMGLVFPITIALIGGYMINREFTDNTLKNIFPIPVSFRRLLTGKLLAMAIVTASFGVYSWLITLICGCIFFPKNLTLITALQGFVQIVGMALCVYIAELPIVAFCGRKPNRFFAGAALSFIYGYLAIFLSGENLQDYYPVSAGLGIIHFGGSTGNSSASYHPAIGCFVLLIMIAVTVAILLCSKRYNENKRMISKK